MVSKELGSARSRKSCECWDEMSTFSESIDDNEDRVEAVGKREFYDEVRCNFLPRF
jgi:hypothetical protein